MKKNKLNLSLDCKANAQKNALLKNAQVNAESNFFKRVFFSPPKKSALPFFTNLFFPPRELTCNLTMSASNINPFGQSVCKLDTTHLLTDRRATDNSGFKKWAVTWLNELLRLVSSSVLADSLVLRNRQLLKPANR